MARSVRTLTSGIMNKDLDERLIPEGQYRDALNIEVDDADGSDSGTARNRLGNTKMGDLSNVCGFPVDNTFLTIGCVAVPEEFKLFYLITSNYFDGVFEYNEKADTLTRVLQSNKSTPSTPSKLNFNKDFYVTGINHVEGFLFWTDGNEQPYGGKVSRWKSYTIDDDRIDDDIRVIKAPPLNPPSISLSTNQDEDNNIEKKFLQFATRYQYLDEQYSAISPFSSVAFDAGTFELDYASGNNSAMANLNNEIKVSFQTGSRFVKKIDLILRDTKNQNLLLVESFDKSVLDIDNNWSYSYEFSNNKTYTVIPEDQLTRLYDNVPLKAKAQEVIGRRLVYGHYTQFYDLKTQQGTPIKVDHKARYISTEVLENVGKRTFRSDRDVEIALVYLDKYGRMTTALTAASGNDTVYIKPDNSIHSNSIVVEIDHEPPTFATHYRVLIKQSKKQYYNLFPLLYYSQGVYRYFLINRSDVDKIKVGEYVIFKANGTGPTLTNKKYKVLEIESKGADFLNNGSSQASGLYFKIKVDPGDFPQSALSTYSTSGYGANNTSTSGFAGFCNQGSVNPIQNPVSYVENPTFYGTSGNGSALTIANGNQYAIYKGDLRVIVEIRPNKKFRYRFVGTSSLSLGVGSWSIDYDIIPNLVRPIYDGNTSVLFNILFSTDTGFDVGDSWRINCRGSVYFPSSENVFGGLLKLMTLPGVSNSVSEQHGGFASFPSDSFAGPIQSGAQIKIWIYQDSPLAANPDVAPYSMTFTSSKYYENIEEWFFEDEIYTQWTQIAGNTGAPVGPESVYFRRGFLLQSVPVANSTVSPHYIDQLSSIPYALSQNVRMMIRGYGTNSGCNQNKFTVNFYVTQLEDPLIAETEPLESDVDIYHETTDTYPIENGLHIVQWTYDDFTFYNGNTRLTQLTPTRPHKFVVGDRVVVSHGTNPSTYVQSGTYTVLEVTDLYSVVIDLPWVSVGPAESGKIALEHKKLGGGFELELDQTSTTPTVLVIGHPDNTNSTFNAYTFGNGLESDRILDDFNETMVEYSPRVTTVIDNYKEDQKKASVCYSNVYRFESSVNRLNEFNLSRSNFKNLNVEFGFVQKLYARDNDLVVFQENKISNLLYEKNILSDAVGGSSLTSVPQVLGTQVPYAGEWGIGSNPESFAQYGSNVFFTDTRRGAVLKLTTGGVFPIVNGMSDYFRDLFMNNPDTMKIGIYDPFHDDYILCHNDRSSNPCRLSINRSWGTYSSYGKLTGAEFVSTSDADFIISSNTEWSLSVSYSSGNGWVTGFPVDGSGDQEVFLGISDNNTGLNRSAVITITYCGGLTTTYTIYQAKGGKRKIVPFIFNSIDPDTNLSM
jgi:hypothetical protein